MSRLSEVFSTLRRYPSAMVGSVLVSLLLIIALLAPVLAPHDPLKLNPRERFEPPSATHIMGTDEYGRDVFSRILIGTRTSLGIGLSVTVICAVVGGFIGLSSGYFGGRIDELIMRGMDILMAFPGILFALLILSMLGSSMLNVIIAISITGIPKTARVARSSCLNVRNEEFIEAAKARGDSTWYILLVEVLPNAVQPIIVEASIKVGFVILTASSLSFLGLGTQPPTPDWGLIVGAAREYIFESPMLIVWPILAIAVTTISFNLLGDGLRDILDPKELGRV